MSKPSRSSAGILNAVGQLAAAAGFLALVAWELAHGLAGGRVNAEAAERASAPGTYCFFIAAQLFIGSTFFARGLKTFVPGLLWKKPALYGLCALLVLGAWMALERAAALATIVLAQTNWTDRLVYAGLGLALLSVIGTLLHQLVWPEIKQRLDAKKGDD